MAVAYWMAHAPQGFFPVQNGGDAAMLFCFVFLYLVFAGPGAWSLDARRARRAVRAPASTAAPASKSRRDLEEEAMTDSDDCPGARRGGAGALPEWDLSDLYAAPDAPEIGRDIDWLRRRVPAFAADYEGKLAGLDAAGLLAAIRR